MPPKATLLAQFDPTLNYPLYLIRNRLLRAIRKHAPRFKGRLLDFGCGIKPYESLFTVDEYIGVDYAGEGETYTKEKADFIYDGKTLPFPDAHFDGIFSTEVIEHIFNLEAILPEITRVLKPGGEMLFTCPFTMPEHEVPSDIARYTSYGLKALFERHGFEVLAFEKTGNFMEAVHQLWLIWLNGGFLQLFKGIPVLRSIMRALVYYTVNAQALFLSWLFPRNVTLYLNNVIVLQKTAA